MRSAAKHLRLLLKIHPIKRTSIIGGLVVVPFAAQVYPGWIRGLHEFNFARSPPALQLLFACDGFRDVAVPLEPYQAIAVVAGSKAIMLFPFVFEYTSLKVAGDSDL
jgi:hypothetical protein